MTEVSMLLPLDCLAYKIVEGRLLPTWLVEADVPFVEHVLDVTSQLDGLQVGEADVVAPAQLAQLSRDHKMSSKLAESLWAIERRRWEARVDAPADPETLRDVVFELAARRPRDEAIAEAARRLAIAPEVVVGSLFADRKARRVLVAPAARTNATELIARYNLTLIQSLVARSMEIVARVVGEPTAVIAAAKRDGLLASLVAEEDGATTLTLTGPLAIFHDTSKYGRSIARFIPALVAGDPERGAAWSMSARVTLGPRSASLHLDHNGAVAFATMPAAPDGRLARKVARLLRSVGVRVDVHPAVERLGTGALVAPDFALEWAGHRVLVDVVPFATDDYLARKALTVRMLDVPMVVCVEQRYIPAHARAEWPWLVPFRQEIDAWALLEGARRAIDRHAERGAAMSAAPPWA